MPTTASAPARRVLAAVALAAVFTTPLGAQSFDPAKDSPLTLLTAPPDPIAYLERRNQGFSLANAQNWAGAEPILEQLTRDYPRDGVNWVMLGSVKSRLDKPREAAAAYEKAASIIGWGDAYNARMYAAANHLAAGDRPRALELLRQYVFDDHTLLRQRLYDLREFAALRNDPEFRRITGHPDTTGWSRTEGWRHDIDYLYEELQRTSPDYRGRPLPAEVRRRYEELKRRVPQLSDAQLYLGMSRMLAPMKAGHTSLFQPTGSRYLPVRFYVFPEGLYIIGAEAGSEPLVGSRVVTIGTLPADEVMKRFDDAHSVDGPQVYLWQMAGLAATHVLAGVGAITRADTVSLVVEGPTGARRTVSLATLAEPPAGRQDRMVAPRGVPTPLYLSRLAEMHWELPMLEHDAMYVQMNNVVNDSDETLAAFGRRLWTVLQEKKPHHLILDLRHNNGGNTSLYTELMRTIIAFSREPNHDVYALLGRRTYSATGNFVTDLERWANPVFVGEPSGECCNFHGDPSHVTLPYSRIEGELSVVRWNLSRNVFDERHEMVPHMPVVLSAKDYFAGQDPALDAVFRMIERVRTAERSR